MNSLDSFAPVKVDAGQMLSEAAKYNVDLKYKELRAPMLAEDSEAVRLRVDCGARPAT